MSGKGTSWRWLFALACSGLLGGACAPAVHPRPMNGAGSLPAGWTRVQEDADFPYVIFTIGVADEGQRLPLLIALHYLSASLPTTLGQFATLPGPARVVVPRGPVPYKNGFGWWVIAPDDGEATAHEAQRMSMLVERLDSFTQRLTRRHATAGKPIVLGLSQGGDLSLLLALRHPDRFEAALPIAARLPPALHAGAICREGHRIPIDFFHGEDDTTAVFAETSALVERLRASNCAVTLHRYPGVRHDYTEAEQADVAARIRALWQRPE